ncbi:hypothetical protein QFC24_004625 [Naganishia onofrii]|uniref:Uncharacterized protein n=1 Tax=Naganishia onofrii TaxID=1851511 RepID=A0ACC2XD43_9TREE|nr:hypothetical protein QFC24_004625 [Naganishia onofrii]
MSAPQKKILVVLTSADKLPNGKPTGWYLPELAHPYYELKDDFELTLVSPAGGAAPLDPVRFLSFLDSVTKTDPDEVTALLSQASVEAFKSDELATKFLSDSDAQKLVKNTTKLSSVDPSKFDAIFYVGGHGPVVDLAVDQDSIKLIENVSSPPLYVPLHPHSLLSNLLHEATLTISLTTYRAQFYSSGKITAAVCHAPAVFKNTTHDGKPLVAGKKFTGFSNAEEEAVGMTNDVPFLLESALKDLGGQYEKAPEAWAPWVVVDGNLYTGQNPASAGPLAQRIKKDLLNGSVELFESFALQLRSSVQGQGDLLGGAEGSANCAVSEQRPSSTRPDDNDLPAAASSASYPSIANPYITQPESIKNRMLHLPRYPEHDEAGLGELVAGVGGTARTARTLLLPDGDGVYPHSRNLSGVAGNRYSMMERDKDIVELGLVTLDFAQILFDKAFGQNSELEATLQQCEEICDGLLFARLLRGEKSREIIQGIMIMTEYKNADDERHYMLLGLACRMAMELGLRKSYPASHDRNGRHDVRLWLALFHAENRFNGCNRSDRPTIMMKDEVVCNADTFYLSHIAVRSDCRLTSGILLRLIIMSYTERMESIGITNRPHGASLCYLEFAGVVDEWYYTWRHKILESSGSGVEHLQMVRHSSKLMLCHRWLKVVFESFRNLPDDPDNNDACAERERACSVLVTEGLGLLDYMMKMEVEQLQFAPDTGYHPNDDASSSSLTQPVAVDWEDALMQAIGLGESANAGLDTLFGDWDLAVSTNATDLHLASPNHPVP